MGSLSFLLSDLVTANRILSREGVVDGLGHISVRHPDRPDRYFMSRARAPECIELQDIMEFALDGTPVDASRGRPYNERFIHGAIFATREDVRSVVHSHSHAVIPFAGQMSRCVRFITFAPRSAQRFRYTIRPPCGVIRISSLPILRRERLSLTSWDGGTTALMTAHGSTVAGGSIRHAVFLAIHLELNAQLQLDTLRLGRPIRYLSPGEVELITRWMTPDKMGEGLDRMWERWCVRADVPFTPNQGRVI